MIFYIGLDILIYYILLAFIGISPPLYSNPGSAPGYQQLSGEEDQHKHGHLQHGARARTHYARARELILSAMDC
jgi:hypothetical protein